MAFAALLVLVTLAASAQLTATAQKDCHVSVTGASGQYWTPARRLEWIPAATSVNQQFAGRPPGGRRELSFSVLSELPALHVRLISSRLPGGFLLQLGETSWTAERTFVGDVGPGDQLAYGAWSEELPAVAADRWCSYAVSVSQPDLLRLERLHDNGTRQLLLELRHPEMPSVELAELRVAPYGDSIDVPQFRHGSGIGPEAHGHWGFWKFDCSKFYYQTVDLCHLWPSWPSSDVPLRFRTPHRRISPVTSITVQLSTNGTAELHLLESDEKFYLVTLTAHELTLGRSERGVPGATREVARACLVEPGASAAGGGGQFRLLWVSILRGFISVGVEGARPCEEDTTTTSTSTTDPQTEETSVTLFEMDDDVTEMTSEIVDVSVTEAATTTTTTTSTAAPRTPLVTWQDGIQYFVTSYGVRTPDGQGVWTVDCQPSADKSSDEDKMSQVPKRGGFSPLPTGNPAKDPGGLGDAGRSCRTQQPFLLATVALSVAAVVLLLVVVLLVTALVSQRRRWTAELAAQRRLSLIPTDVFSGPPPPLAADGDHEYAEVHLYDRIWPNVSAQPGESTFKPRRRQTKSVETQDSAGGTQAAGNAKPAYVEIKPAYAEANLVFGDATKVSGDAKAASGDRKSLTADTTSAFGDTNMMSTDAQSTDSVFGYAEPLSAVTKPAGGDTKLASGDSEFASGDTVSKGTELVSGDVEPVDDVMQGHEDMSAVSRTREPSVEPLPPPDSLFVSSL